MNDVHEDLQSLHEEVQERFRENINDGVRLYRKYRRQAVVTSLVSIVASTVYLILFWIGINIPLLLIGGAAVGFAITARYAYKEVEKIPILGYLIVLSHELNVKTLTAEEFEEQQEQRRMEYQQYEAPGFAAPVSGM